MINFQELEKVAVFKNGELNWLEGRDINAVYVILVRDEYYIGSSHYVYNRIGQHLRALLKGECHSRALQKKFDNIQSFEVYVLERGISKQDLNKKEFEYIKKFKPTLNSLLDAWDKTELNKHLCWLSDFATFQIDLIKNLLNERRRNGEKRYSTEYVVSILIEEIIDLKYPGMREKFESKTKMEYLDQLKKP